jgi:hypothetical protein
MNDAGLCRLCGGLLTRQFNLVVLRKHDVTYYECQSCDSLQTENPYWLDEAYDHSLSNLDTGAAQRVLRNLAAAFAVAKLFGLNNAVDVGGGDGLLCRFLRDYGINCFIKDKYAIPAYAQGFTNPDFDVPELVFGFEVMEHFRDPQIDLDALFGTRASVVLVSTCIYSNQREDWWYLAPEGGQHVFFYSENALKLISQRYGCDLLISNDMILFVRRGLLGTLRSLCLRVLLNKYASRVFRSMVVFLPTPGASRDHLRLKAVARK